MTSRIVVALVAALAACSVRAVSAVQLEPALTGLSSPIFVTSARDGSQRLFVVQQGGIIKVLAPGAGTPTTFLDITGLLRSGGEQGLLGLAFHPQFSSNGRFFVDYTRQADGATVIAEYHASATDPNAADPTGTPLLVIAQPFANHNGGMLAFGPDGFLYIGMGDGGDANDPGNRAQDIDQLLGKILRIDVDHPNGPALYSSPSSNPFFGATPGRDEIYAVGMRNPWRFSFDRATGQLYVGDVGQGAVEEVDIVTRGGNYGWRIWEGSSCSGNDPQLCSTSGFTFPIAEYTHASGRCSITGGYVYRGTLGTLPAGAYVYGDYCSGEVFLYQGGSSSLLVDTGFNISSFGEDESGELYVVALGGAVHRLVGDQVCTFSVSPTTRSVAGGGLQGAVETVTAPAGCEWTASSADSWISITSGAGGAGNGQVVFSVAANSQSASSRTGTLTIAGRTVTVTQAGCAFTLSPASRAVAAGGIASTSASVTAAAGCPWAATSNDPWLAITNGASHAGNGQVLFSVAPNQSDMSPRTGTLTIAGKTFTVSQAACTFTLSPTSRAVAVGGVSSTSAGVTAPAGCGWTAASNDDWIAITNGASHSGGAQVLFSVAPNQSGDGPRTGTLTIADQTFTVTQASCAFTVAGTSRSVPVGGIPGVVVGVSAPGGCGWAALSNDPWIAVTNGSGHAGNGQVNFSVAANTGSSAQRTGTLTIAGHTFTVVEAGCVFTLSATSRSIAAAGLQSSPVGVSAAGGCAWTATSNDPWIAIVSGASGAGNGQVTFSVAPNPGPARTGALTIAGRTFTVTQAAAP